MTTVEAELKRRDSSSNLVDWLLVDDPENTETGLSDPVIDFAARASLEQLVAASPSNTRDTDNEQTSPLGASATFLGDWTRIDGYQSVQILYAATTALTSVAVEWSNDGVNQISGLLGSSAVTTRVVQGYNVAYQVYSGDLIAPYYRLRVVNGATPQGAFPLFISINWLNNSPYNGAFIFLEDTLTNVSKALLVRSVQAGIDPNANFVNSRIQGRSTANSTTTPLGSGAVFRGTWFEWQNNYVGVVVEAKASHSGTLHVDFSSAVAPVDGNDTSVGDSLVSAYDPALIPLLRRVEPVQSRWCRIRFVNGGTAQTSFSLDAAFVTSAPPVSQVRIDTALTDADLAATGRSVTVGKQPDGDYINSPADGEAYITQTPLAAAQVLSVVSTGLGSPLETASGAFNSDGYNTIEVGIDSDVQGEVSIEYCDNVDNPSANFFAGPAITYGPDDVGRFINFPKAVGLDGFRLTYTNNATQAQAYFLLAIQLRLTAPGPPKTTLDANIEDDAEAVMSRAALLAGDAAGQNHEPIGRDGLGAALNTHVTGFDPDVLLRPLPSGDTSQRTVGITTPTRLDPIPLANRRAIALANMEATNGAVFGFSSLLTEATGFDLPAGRAIPFDVSDDVELWAVAKNTGGSTNVQHLAGTTNAGTATSTANAKVLDAVYSDIAAAAQTINIGGYSITPTLSSIQSVKLGVVGKKQAGQTQTVVPVETQTGNAGNVGSVATAASIAGGSLQTYLAFISREKGNATVTGVTGLGLGWTQVDSGVQGTNRAVDVWKANGTATAGIVTATFSLTATNCHISVVRFTGVDQTTPVQGHAQAIGNSATPATGAITGTAKGVVVVAGAVDNNTPSASATWTPLSNEVTAAGASRDGLGVEYKALVSGGSVTPTMTSSASVQWAAVGVTLAPADAIAPSFTLSYELSAVAGATTQNLTLNSTSDTTNTLDVTGDRVWVFADIPNVHVFATGLSVGDAAAEIDQLYLEVTETSAATCRISLMELA